MEAPKPYSKAEPLNSTPLQDFQNGSVKEPEYFGKAMACTDTDAVASAFTKGLEDRVFGV